MKTFFKLISIFYTFLAAVSCDVDAVGTIYEPDDTNNGVTFNQSLFTDSGIPASATSYTVVVNRAVAKTAQTVGISTTLPEEIVVPDHVSFAVGEYQTPLVLDISQMAVGSTRRGVVKFTDEKIYDANTAIFSADIVLTKVDK